MAKGKITEYNQPGFSPAATGVPGQDRSGQILGQAMSNLGQAMSKRADTVNNLTAMDSFGSFELEYQQRKLDMQKQFSDKPMEYGPAVRKMSQDLADQMGKTMSGEVVQKFRQMTTAALAQDTDNLAKWSFARERDINVGKITSIKQNIAIKASTVSSVDDLKTIQADFAAASLESTKLIDKESDNELTLKYWELAKKHAVAAQTFARPMQFYRDLEGGAYDGVLDADEKLTAKNKARDAILNRAQDEQYRTAFLSQGKLLDFQNGIETGKTTITDLINEREAAAAQSKKVDALGKPVIDPNYVKGLDNLIDTVMYANQRLPANKEDRQVALKKFDTDWDTYLAEKKQSGQGPNEGDADKELEMYAGLSDLYRKGTISKADFDQKVSVMRTKLALKQGQIPRIKSFNDSVDQAGTVPNLWWRKPGNDVVSLGYQMIKDHIDQAYPELGTDERRDLKAQMLAQYHQKIHATPDETFKTLQTENQRKNFAQQAIFGTVTDKGVSPGVATANATYFDPVGQKNIPVGGMVSQFGATKIFKGRNPDGTALWEIAPSSVGKEVAIKNRKYKIAGLNAQGEFMLKEVIDNAK